MHVQAYLYQGYWEDIGTVEAFYESNLALTDNPAPKFRCLRPPSLPPWCSGALRSFILVSAFTYLNTTHFQHASVVLPLSNDHVLVTYAMVS